MSRSITIVDRYESFVSSKDELRMGNIMRAMADYNYLYNRSAKIIQFGKRVYMVSRTEENPNEWLHDDMIFGMKIEKVEGLQDNEWRVGRREELYKAVGR